MLEFFSNIKHDSRKKTILLLSIGLFITGTVNTVIAKLSYSHSVSGCCGDYNFTDNNQPHKFNHPWFSTWIMFFGEMLCFIPFLVSTRWIGGPQLNKSPELNDQINTNTYAYPYSYIIVFMALSDIINTALIYTALTLVDASIWQMMRVAVILWTVFFSKIIIKRKLILHNWIGLIIVVIGFILVSWAGLDIGSKSGNITNIIISIIMIFIAGGFNGFMFAYEEYLLKHVKVKYTPLNLVFMEGFWGFTVMSLVLLPFLYFLHPFVVSENIFDCFSQMNNAWILYVETAIIIISMALFNYFGISITFNLTSVHRSLLDSCRIVSVWIFQILLYEFNLVNSGEKIPFDLSASNVLQLIGSIFLISGTIIYGGLLKIPCSKYDPPSDVSVDQLSKDNSRM